jgi:hypothetical protein
MIDHHQVTHDLGVAGLKLTPPAIIYGLTLNEWVAVVGIIYTLISAAHLIWKWTREARSPAGEPAAR